MIFSIFGIDTVKGFYCGQQASRILTGAPEKIQLGDFGEYLTSIPSISSSKNMVSKYFYLHLS